MTTVRPTCPACGSDVVRADRLRKLIHCTGCGGTLTYVDACEYEADRLERVHGATLDTIEGAELLEPHDRAELLRFMDAIPAIKTIEFSLEVPKQ